MKKTFAVILLLTLILTVFVGCSNKKLSEMSDKKLVSFLEDKGVEIPEQINVEQTRYLIIWLEEDPDGLFHGSYVVYAEFCEELRPVVKEYYGIE